ncbi:MAG: hypothetical protein R3B09_35025 [Nannocystaceae bacterium]
MLDFAWLCAFAALIEPTIPAIAAWLGRRFAGDGAATSIQRSLAAGWSAPEAAIHLYAPALGIGLAALLAMPGQLALEHRGAAPSALPWPSGRWPSPPRSAWSPSFYACGLWEAALRVFHESIRSLAGPLDGAPAARLLFARLAPTLRPSSCSGSGPDRWRWFGSSRLAWTAVILVRRRARGPAPGRRPRARRPLGRLLDRRPPGATPPRPTPRRAAAPGSSPRRG